MQMVFASFATSALLQLALICLLVKGPNDLLKTPVLYFLATLPIMVVLLRKARFKFMVTTLDIRRIFAHLSSSIIIWLISVCAQTYNNLDIIILGMFRPAAEVGYFTVARRTVATIGGLLVFLANAILPHLAHTFHGDSDQFHHATRRFLRLATLIAVFGFIPAIIFSKQLIISTVGAGYLDARAPLIIMIVGMTLVFFNMPYSTGLIAGGFEKKVLKQAAASALISVVSNFILVPKYGMIGAAVTFLIVEAVAFTWIIWIYHRKIGFRFAPL
jgi:O-antigen/teichoic acid export membrane protein